jgi:competence protein ComEC
MPPAQQGRDGELSLQVLDAGQGTAALVNSGEYLLLYDSGPGDGRQQNIVAGVIAPALAGMHRNAPSEIIISHADLDHAGGVQSLLALYPDAHYRVNLNGRHNELPACTSPLIRTHSGIRMETLHPTPWLPYLGNDSSCVISLASAGGSVLLSGDISEVIENRLIRAGLAPHRLLLVPHHGSNTSSSRAFIETLRPEVAIATASLGNRFGFPRAEIRERYESAGVKFWSTGECGALRVLLGADGTLHADSARRQRNRIWRWPAAANCP